MLMQARRYLFSGALVPALAALSVAAPGSAVAEASCAPASVVAIQHADVPLVDWAENVGYDERGDLWVSRLERDEVQRYDSTGRVTATVAVESHGAVRMGPDHLVYVDFGDSLSNIAAGSHGGGVVRFDPYAAAPQARIFVGGLGMANGAAFDAAGNLYVADSSAGVVRVRPDATVDAGWTAQARSFGADGIIVVGNSAYVTLLTSPTGRILRIPLRAPSGTVDAVDVGSAPTPALPDDLAVAPDGMFYLATGTGRLVRIDPRTNAACTVLTGEPMTSVAVVPGAGRDLTIGTESGDVLHVRLNRAG